MTWSSAERLARIERQGQDLPHTGFPDLAEQPNQRPEIHLWVLHCQPDDPAHDHGRARTLQPRRGGHAFQVVRGLAVPPYQRRLRMTFRAAEESAALGVNRSRLATPWVEQIAGSRLACPFLIWISSTAVALPFPFFTMQPPDEIGPRGGLNNRGRNIASSFQK